MLSLQLLLAAGALSAYVGYSLLCLARNVRVAKASGVPFVIVPFYVFHRFWLLTHPIWLKLMRKLPGTWKSSLDYMTPDWSWRHRYYPFMKLGTDIFMTVSPGGNILWVADPNVVTQITTRYFQAPIAPQTLPNLALGVMISPSPYICTDLSIYSAET